ncbi:DMT family transporter [Photobacterium aphoticum]|uniref:Ethidium bromide-methyl viologen resistance protein EmrE n=1 Tax=Photobacterium aphoticum TaxID=754436 RepID=A0A0J1GNF7_9GAMM|nr:multidrug efflux SMR transporter [Photobacterium aphoticum]KLV01255.1 hypothetical protein ABT58_09035 [Photobacterium aphoticum]PSU56312.1 QacE family quaternary ammonium compound efflux SMR transporter [Photobacterium aphoticum]GHA50178.1 QacE family quaternary ammonium compound efflux SMR transporter [Photobacterium aphoticum]
MLAYLSALPAYVSLSAAILFEVIATSLLPRTQSFTSLPYTVTVLGCYGLAFFLLSVTVKTLSIGVAYAIWCGVGIVLVASAGWLLHGQKLDVATVIGMALIIAGVIIINLFSGNGH